MIALSARLAAIARRVKRRTVADVACDHAYLPIYLAQCGQIDRAVASDIHAAPLAKARRHIGEAGLGACVETRLADGLAGAAPGECETLVVAGVGGMTLIDILAAHLDAAKSFRQLLLSPQRDYAAARGFLLQNGFAINDEEALWDGGKFYVILDCSPGLGDADYDDCDLHFGKWLLARRDAALRAYIEAESRRANRAILNAGNEKAPALRAYATLCAEALARWGESV